MLVVFAEMDSPIPINHAAPLRATAGRKWTYWSGDAQRVCYVLLSFHFGVKSTN
jgi:hypothetical protein